MVIGDFALMKISVRFGKVVGILFILLVCLGIILIPKFSNIDGVRKLLFDYYKFSFIIFVFFQIFQCVSIFIPLTPLTIAGGLVFGPYIGTFLSWIGLTLGDTICFFLAKYFGRAYVEKKIGSLNNRFSIEILSRNTTRISFYIIIGLFFLSGMVSFDVLSYTLGLTKVRYRHFIILLSIGIVPKLIVLNLVSNYFLSSKVPIFALIIAIVLFFGVLVTSYFLFMKRPKP
jgi:uncharacterized membrane protein YdjX (TVP38/TMEM64 family)